jgi:hypothetical protein
MPAREAGPQPAAFGLRILRFGGKRSQPIGEKRPQERFQDDFGLAQTRSEIGMKGIQRTNVKMRLTVSEGCRYTAAYSSKSLESERNDPVGI